MFDAIVIGAGASGSHVAERLSRSGHRVLVVEKQPEAGFDVCCTGIVGPECFDLLRPSSAVLHRVASAATFVAPSGRTLRLERPEPVAYILDRGALDRSLMERARAAGTGYRFSTQVLRLEHRDAHVQLTVQAGGATHTLLTRSVVIAAGYGSGLPGALGLGRIPDCLIGAQAEVRTTIDEVQVFVDQDLAPGGFAWLVPTGHGGGLAGLVTRRQHEQRLTRFLERLRARDLIASTDCCRSYGAIPIRPRPRTFTDRVLLVGDAAGQVKPTTGGGIYYGVLCGDIAAEVLHDALETDQLSARRLAVYEQRWQSRLNRELTVGYLAHRLWRRLSNREVELLFELAARTGLGELVTSSRHFSFDWHGPLLTQLAALLPFPTSMREQPPA